MQYLLDTHVILWWLEDPKKISAKARNIIADKKNTIFVSSVSIWEMAIKKDLGRLNIPTNILSVLKSDNMQILPLNAEDSLGIMDLSKIHNDPFDRILVSQAKINDLIFITKDQKILEYPVVSIKA